MEHRGIEERVRPISNRIRKPVATRVPPGSVVLLTRARRQRTRQRLDAAACDVHDGDRGHADHRLFQHAGTERARGIFFASHAERPAYVVAPGVARGGLLCERLHVGIDGQIDRKTDVDGAAADDDAVWPEAIRRPRALRVGGGIGVIAIERSARTMQRLEGTQHDTQGRRDLPSFVVDSNIRCRLAGEAQCMGARISVGGA